MQETRSDPRGGTSRSLGAYYDQGDVTHAKTRPLTDCRRPPPGADRLLSTACSGCDIITADLKAKESAEWRKTYQLQPGGRVEISNVNGKIDVTPSSDDTVEVVATKIARGATPEAAKAALERIEITEEANSALIKIQTKVARTTGIFHGTLKWIRGQVPPSAEVRFTTVNGGIEIAGLDGRVNAETTNGGIRARDVGGPIEASTTNGGVDVE